MVQTICQVIMTSTVRRACVACKLTFQFSYTCFVFVYSAGYIHTYSATRSNKTLQNSCPNKYDDCPDFGPCTCRIVVLWSGLSLLLFT